MSDRHSRKSRPRRKSSDDLGAFTSDEHIQQGLEVLKGQGKPTCATCWHCEPRILENDEPSIEGTCFGVPPVIVPVGALTFSFPTVKLSWRCPNWRKAK